MKSLLRLAFVGLFSVTVLAQTQPNGPTVTVVGAVQKPGIYQINTGLTLLQLGALFGGFQRTADTSKIEIVRVTRPAAADDLSETFRIDRNEILSGKKKDFQLQPGDVISVPFR